MRRPLPPRRPMPVRPAAPAPLLGYRPPATTAERVAQLAARGGQIDPARPVPTRAGPPPTPRHPRSGAPLPRTLPMPIPPVPEEPERPGVTLGQAAKVLGLVILTLAVVAALGLYAIVTAAAS